MNRTKANQTIQLNGTWTMSCEELKCQIPATVPGSVYLDLLQSDIIPDPFYGDNEYLVREYMNYDYTYERTFYIDHELLRENKNFLVFQGIDTLGEIYLNEQLIATTDNMHRTYRFPVDKELKPGENKIKVVLKSCLQYIKEKESACPYKLQQASDAVSGYIHLRKGSSMFGWDWGPQLPDAGIWRDVFIESISAGRIQDILIQQKHLLDMVVLDIDIEIENQIEKEQLKLDLQLIDPNGNFTFNYKQIDLDELLEFNISNPKLWYPIGYGPQHLYTLVVTLTYNDILIEQKQLRFGLKEIVLDQTKDKWGESFTFIVNGIPFFGKGSNYIPEDNLLSRNTKEKTRDLLQSAIDANHNMIRVWGGGIYPEDYFFDLCDEMGILIWQDLMFACSVYNMEDQALVDTMKEEIIDNLIRMRHHPSIALICGNNENEMAIESWHVPSLKKSKEFYIQQYIELIPPLVEKYFPGVAYWRSSPASKTLFKDTNSDGTGDMHYWGVWHNNEPITWYRLYFPRFMSEFGLQSFPELRTVSTFAKEEEFNIFSYVLEQHQKNKTANSKILNYVGKMFRYPKDFDSLLYVSQLIQAEGIRYGVEHWRRNYGRVMGILYWQLNDCWPVASWSSIDYYHRWKALHYHSKKFYQPVLISFEETGKEAKVFITNDTLQPKNGIVNLYWMDFDGKILWEYHKEVSIKAQSSEQIETVRLTESKKQMSELVLVSEFVQGDEVISSNMVSFLPDKYLNLRTPNYKIEIQTIDDLTAIDLTSDTFTKYVELKLEEEDNHFSDNYFHLLPNQPKRILVKTNLNLIEHPEQIQIRSLKDTY